MDCAYLNSSDTNISDYFDSSKSCWKFLNNRVKVPLKSDFSSGVALYKKRMSIKPILLNYPFESWSPKEKAVIMLPFQFYCFVYIVVSPPLESDKSFPEIEY